MGIMAGVGGLVGGLSGLFGSNANSVSPPPSAIPMADQVGAANSAFSNIGNFANTFGNLGQSTLPNAQNIFNSLYGNPFASMAQTGANTAAGMGTTAATNAFNTGGALTSAGTGLLPYATQIMNTAFDPQQSLYNSTLNQVQQQANAQNVASGVSTTPYGASVAGADIGNFNVNWQNQQLQRQALGAQAAGGLVNTGAGVANMGAGIQNTAPGQYATAAAMPYATSFGIGSNQNQALGQLLQNYGSAAGLDNTSIQNYLAFLQAGNASNQTANQQFQTLLNQNQLANNQNMMFGSSIGNALALLGKSNSTNSPFLGNLNFG